MGIVSSRKVQREREAAEEKVANEESEPQRNNSTEVGSGRNRVGSTISASSMKGRSRAASRLSIRRATLKGSLGRRRVKSIVLHDQRFRDNLFNVFKPGNSNKSEVTNPRYNRGRRAKNQPRPKTTEVQVRTETGPEKLDPDRKAKSLGPHQQENQPKAKSVPAPPSDPKIRPRYATWCEKHPFNTGGKYDIRSESFSAISMSKEQLKRAAVEMILCVVNEDIIHSDKLFIERKKSSRTRTIFTSFSMTKRKSAKLDGKKTSKMEQTLRGRLTGGKNMSTDQLVAGLEDEIVELTPAQKNRYTHYLEMPDCLSEELKKAVEVFVDDIERGYTNTQYHSFKHAVDVTQMMFMLIFFLNKNLDRIQPFTMIVSCLCHDIGHFGANNNFLRSKFLTNNKFIEMFGEESPLEKYHIFKMKKVLQQSVLFSAEFMPLEIYKKFITFSEVLILNTDMDRHVNCLNSAKKDAEDEKELIRGGADQEAKLPIPESFLVLSIKLCDVANVSRDFNDARVWTDLLSREFKALGTIEKNTKYLVDNTKTIVDNYEASLESGNFVICDQLSVDTLIKYQRVCSDPDFADCSQLTLGFMQAVTTPMAKLLMEVQQQAGWFLLDRMRQNQQSWIVAIKQADQEKQTDDL